MNDCAMVTVPCLITVAAGVLAPGHLGELTRFLPFELADDVLEGTRTVQKRMRALPSRVGIYFVLAMTKYRMPPHFRAAENALSCRQSSCGSCPAGTARARRAGLPGPEPGAGSAGHGAAGAVLIDAGAVLIEKHLL